MNKRRNNKIEISSLLVSRRLHPGTPYRTVDRTHVQTTIDDAGAKGNIMCINGNQMDASGEPYLIQRTFVLENSIAQATFVHRMPLDLAVRFEVLASAEGLVASRTFVGHFFLFSQKALHQEIDREKDN